MPGTQGYAAGEPPGTSDSVLFRPGLQLDARRGEDAGGPGSRCGRPSPTSSSSRPTIPTRRSCSAPMPSAPTRSMPRATPRSAATSHRSQARPRSRSITAQYEWSNVASFTQAGGYGRRFAAARGKAICWGLGHAGPYNEQVDNSAQLGAMDSRQWTIMSYINPFPTYPYGSGRYAAQYTSQNTNWGVSADGYYNEPTTWMPLDILAAQRLYGVATTTPAVGAARCSGSTATSWARSSRSSISTINATPVVTLWDAGGDNTLDVSGFAAAALIDLRPGAFSSVGRPDQQYRHRLWRGDRQRGGRRGQHAVHRQRRQRQHRGRRRPGQRGLLRRQPDGDRPRATSSRRCRPPPARTRSWAWARW